MDVSLWGILIMYSSFSLPFLYTIFTYFVFIQYFHKYDAKIHSNYFAMGFLHFGIMFLRTKQQVFCAVLNSYLTFINSNQMHIVFHTTKFVCASIPSFRHRFPLIHLCILVNYYALQALSWEKIETWNKI